MYCTCIYCSITWRKQSKSCFCRPWRSRRRGGRRKDGRTAVTPVEWVNEWGWEWEWGGNGLKKRRALGGGGGGGAAQRPTWSWMDGWMEEAAAAATPMIVKRGTKNPGSRSRPERPGRRPTDRLSLSDRPPLTVARTDGRRREQLPPAAAGWLTCLLCPPSAPLSLSLSLSLDVAVVTEHSTRSIHLSILPSVPCSTLFIINRADIERTQRRSEQSKRTSSYVMQQRLWRFACSSLSVCLYEFCLLERAKVVNNNNCHDFFYFATHLRQWFRWWMKYVRSFWTLNLELSNKSALSRSVGRLTVIYQISISFDPSFPSRLLFSATDYISFPYQLNRASLLLSNSNKFFLKRWFENYVARINMKTSSLLLSDEHEVDVIGYVGSDDDRSSNEGISNWTRKLTIAEHQRAAVTVNAVWFRSIRVISCITTHKTWLPFIRSSPSGALLLYYSFIRNIPNN